MAKNKTSFGAIGGAIKRPKKPKINPLRPKNLPGERPSSMKLGGLKTRIVTPKFLKPMHLGMFGGISKGRSRRSGI